MRPRRDPGVKRKKPSAPATLTSAEVRSGRVDRRAVLGPDGLATRCAGGGGDIFHRFPKVAKGARKCIDCAFLWNPDAPVGAWHPSRYSARVGTVLLEVTSNPDDEWEWTVEESVEHGGISSAKISGVAITSELAMEQAQEAAQHVVAMQTPKRLRGSVDER